jgi:DnaK suppressor protein
MNEEALLAQSDNEYMGAEQLGYFKQRLMVQADELRHRLRNYQASCEIERHPDAGDFASDEEHRALTVTMIERDKLALGCVNQALDALAHGDYGFCRETGEPIGLPRLLLVPESLYSVESMRIREARGIHQRQAQLS